MPRVLFILKRREDFDPTKHSKLGMSTGLFNSATFVNNMLVAEGVESKLVVVIDNNDIDREVTLYKPTHVIIEALWVVPPKFDILSRLHPKVKWIIRLHSEAPFIAQEGMAFDWIGDYVRFPNIILGINAPRIKSEVETFIIAIDKVKYAKNLNEKIIYLPNYYPQFMVRKHEYNIIDKEIIDVGCFGAVRPLKNNLVQALGALKYVEQRNKKLRFHINARIEKGEPVVQNLKCMFQHLYEAGHQLISHSWTPHEEFSELCSTMDFGMQATFSETFNIVGADMVARGVPFIGTKEIPWIHFESAIDPTSSDEIAELMESITLNPLRNVNSNQKSLVNYADETRKIWLSYFSDK